LWYYAAKAIPARSWTVIQDIKPPAIFAIRRFTRVKKQKRTIAKNAHMIFAINVARNRITKKSCSKMQVKNSWLDAFLSLPTFIKVQTFSTRARFYLCREHSSKPMIQLLH